MDSVLEIPRYGRSPDFVHRRLALPGFPVVCKSAPVHSDCIVPDLHRLPFSPDKRAPWRYILYFFGQFYYSIDPPVVN